MKNIRFVLAAMLLGCVAMVSCQKDDIPEGAIRLFAEGFQSDDKTSVSGNAVYWEDGEIVTINDQSLEVIVDIPHYSDTRIAYISYNVYGSFQSSIHGYYGIGGCSGYGDGSFTGIDFPRSYNSTYLTNGRQVIALPMVAYNSDRSSSVKFRHISAAVLVKVKNEMGSTIVIDSVSVTSTNGKKLSGNGVSATFPDPNPYANGLPVVDPNNVEGNNNYNSTAVIIGNSTTIVNNAILEVQVPILPVSDCNLKVRVYSHNANASVNERYTFEHTVEGITLGRNEMLTAGCRINTTTGRVAIGRTIDLSDLTDDYTAQNGDILTGSLQRNVKVSIADGATITLRSARIFGSSNISNANGMMNYSHPGLTCLGDATIILAQDPNSTASQLYLDTNYIGAGNGAGIQVPANQTLTIQGNGSLVASGVHGAGIGGKDNTGAGNIVINCAPESKIRAKTTSGAGIGGGKSGSVGDITINSGTIDCKGPASAAIGGGEFGSAGDITINGGTINCKGAGGAAIGGGNGGSAGDIIINGGTLDCKAGSGAGIGGGELGSARDITINGGTLVCRGDHSAAIGTGNHGDCGNITINGGNVTATGGAAAAGIGSAWGLYSNIISECGNITITGGIIHAIAYSPSAAIGSGKGYENDYNDIELSDTRLSKCGNIIISGGNVTAETYSNTYTSNNVTSRIPSTGAAIGSGGFATCGAITITGQNTTVRAAGFPYTTNNNSSLLSNSVPIGAGKKGICNDISIQNATIYYIKSIDAAVVGTGEEGTCGNILFVPGTVYRVTSDNSFNDYDAIQTNQIIGGQNAAAVGSGRNGTCGNISIVGSGQTFQGGINAAGIGTGLSGTCGNINVTGYGTVPHGVDATYTIGPGEDGNGTSTCGTVIVNDTTYTSGYTWTAFGTPPSKGKNRRKLLK